ncbi:hypothetical protein CAPTEDRAFT_213485 [Capitella teleta]|uniref:Uncharacterized protein n=1 Tax=Capitella teleta TaxID=283909 RepID=R7TKW7_CAPTE|nr:hypothetical protein CAPTEDRAFT_213485 [Capitella teleta]|eukprot:ELT94468.1 hypothetical protein CAPTEDRAFT_213485 [Capitella teleta]
MHALKKRQGKTGRTSVLATPTKLPAITDRTASRLENTERKVSTDVAAKGLVTSHFVYSVAVETTFRHQFQSSAFGPRQQALLQEAQPPEAVCNVSCDIPRAQELYRDFLFVRRNLESNHRHIAKMKRESGEMDEAANVASQRPGLKLPRLSMRNVISMAKFRSKLNTVDDESGKTSELPALSEKSSLVTKFRSNPCK